ncbi:hypothetical protein IAT40_001307 [Kwoniella sp. CBS 6097]
MCSLISLIPLLVCLAYLAQALPSPLVFPWPVRPGPTPNTASKYVRFELLDTCPKLSERPRPKSAKDVRPDDFRVVMALGDSISAGLLARGGQDTEKSRSRAEIAILDGRNAQQVFESNSGQSTGSGLGRIPWRSKLGIPEIAEWRGISYPIGLDEDAITFSTILQHYTHRRFNESLIGGSRGRHPPLACAGIGIGVGCLPHPEEDGLNAAISGSVSEGLMSQVRDHLIPTIKAMDVKDEDWKFVNLGIGANDVCAFCLTPNMADFYPTGSPKQYAENIKNAVNELRVHVPNMIVNIIGLFRVSSIYKLTLKDPYCQAPGLPFPHLALECSCALLPGPAGDLTRRKMDELGEAYDQAVLEVIREWQHEADDNFGVTWQPGTAVDLENYPITALSPIDCFHPSEAAHQRVGAGFWNRLTMNLEDKYEPIPWDEDGPLIRCLEEEDRIQVDSVSVSVSSIVSHHQPLWLSHYSKDE